MNIYKCIISLIALFYFLEGSAQSEHKSIFYGIQPMVTKEKFYDKNEYDVNIIPLVVQKSISKRLDFRITSVVNYHFGDSPGFSDLGAGLTLPIFVKSKEKINEKSKGFYIAPFIGVGNNVLNHHYTITPSGELGYQFSNSKKFSFTVFSQLGASYFKYENKELWRQHFGIRVNLGIFL
jgi:hypothetical protein